MRSKWRCEPALLNAIQQAIAARASIRLIEAGLVPSEERNDARLLAQAAALDCTLLITYDSHLRGIDFEQLTLIFHELDLSTPVIATPAEVVKVFPIIRKIMRWTQTLIPTLKETPAEAEIVSHKLLLRAGLIRKLTGGLYTFLPLGLRALRKIEQIVREEMNRAGALELLMPALQPPEIWQQSGRYETAADVLFQGARSRQKRMGARPYRMRKSSPRWLPGEISSYRQLPKNFYQIQTKFRDEIRPRFGLMRAKEFIMKDAYSFDATDEAAQVELSENV